MEAAGRERMGRDRGEELRRSAAEVTLGQQRGSLRQQGQRSRRREPLKLSRSHCLLRLSIHLLLPHPPCYLPSTRTLLSPLDSYSSPSLDPSPCSATTTTTTPSPCMTQLASFPPSSWKAPQWLTFISLVDTQLPARTDISGRICSRSCQAGFRRGGVGQQDTFRPGGLEGAQETTHRITPT